jgi:hypothetical protein
MHMSANWQFQTLAFPTFFEFHTSNADPHSRPTRAMKDWAAAVAPARGTQALQRLSIRGLAFMPHKGLLTAQLGAGGMRLNAGGIFNAVGWTRYQGERL